jgi:hypothetical protein
VTTGEIISVSSVGIAVLIFLYGVLKDTFNKKWEGGKMTETLRNVGDKLQTISDSQIRFETKQDIYSERLTRAEESTKSAHHRIDDHEVRIVKLEEKN